MAVFSYNLQFYFIIFFLQNKTFNLPNYLLNIKRPSFTQNIYLA